MVIWYDLNKIYFKYTNICKDIKQILIAVISAWLDLWSFIPFLTHFCFISWMCMKCSDDSGVSPTKMQQEEQI